MENTLYKNRNVNYWFIFVNFWVDYYGILTVKAWLIEFRNQNDKQKVTYIRMWVTYVTSKLKMFYTK